MAISATLVKQLRDETDAPMMECKAALVEAEGDIDKARTILREKGQAAAAKRAGRQTGQGIAMFVTSDDAKSAAGIVIECETDFVAINQDFISLATDIATAVLKSGQKGEIADPSSIPASGGSIGELVEGAVAKIRENIQLKRAVRLESGNRFAVYNHHNRKQASAVELSGDASTIADAGFQVAVQIIAKPPQFLRREDVPESVINQEIATETQRAINEGKDAKMAENIARGRVNKEFYQEQVLNEQLFYDASKVEGGKGTVGDYLAQQGKAGGGTITVVGYHRLAVGEE